jgi:predicted RNase H-like HicB family nuclease
VNDASSLEDVLGIPYIVAVESRVHEGEWVRQASHPELPGCRVSAATVEAALELLDIAREQYLVEACRRGEPVPRPRRALSTLAGASAIEPEATSLAATPTVRTFDDNR